LVKEKSELKVSAGLVSSEVFLLGLQITISPPAHTPMLSHGLPSGLVPVHISSSYKDWPDWIKDHPNDLILI
jgi:hypothetical protein